VFNYPIIIDLCLIICIYIYLLYYCFVFQLIFVWFIIFILQTAIAIIEKDKSGTMDCAWSYPSIDATTEEIIVNRTTLQADGFFFSKHKGVWQYFLTAASGDSVPSVTHVTICILSPIFHPEKWSALLKVFSSQCKSLLNICRKTWHI
jgi:hypothetical protein